MKLHWHVILEYLGNNPSTYLDMKMTLFDNQTTSYYRQRVGDGNISDFISFLFQLNQSRTDPIDDIFNVDVFLRLAVIESFFIQDDNFCAGNNFFLFREYGSSMWTVYTHDFDSVFDKLDTLASRNV